MRASHPLGRTEAALAAATGVVGLLAARTYPLWRSEWSLVCPIWVIAGIPCPTCGGTRAAAAFAAGDPAAALLWNPLVALLAGGAVLALPWLIAVAGGWVAPPRVPTQLSPALRVVLGGALLANWAYLLVFFRG